MLGALFYLESRQHHGDNLCLQVDERRVAAVAPRDTYANARRPPRGECIIAKGFSPGFYCAKQSRYAGEHLHKTSYCWSGDLSCHAEK